MSVSNYLFYKKQHKYRSLCFQHKFLKQYIKAFYGVRVNRRLPGISHVTDAELWQGQQRRPVFFFWVTPKQLVGSISLQRLHLGLQ